MFKGSIVAIVTPFNESGSVDFETLRELVNFQIDNGTDAIVPCGTTGEASTLDHDEHLAVIKAVVEQSAGRVPVIAGTGSNSTAEAIQMTMEAKKIGADGALLVAPYYNKPTQEGLFRHHMAVADAVALPQILYNIPGRTGVNMLPETIARLAEHSNIVAIKEASGSLQQVSEIISLCGDKLSLFSGDDFITLPMMACGARGVISVLANILPDTVADLVDACLAGDFMKGRQLHLHTLKISSAMFIEGNPVPVKTALQLMGKASADVRLPLCPLEDNNKAKLAAIMKEYHLI